MNLMTIQALLQQGMFEIPNYQRGYAWGKEQVAELIDDLNDTLTPKINEHYTGQITVIQQKDENSNPKIKSIFPKQFNVYEVVDGQQRLTTFSIIIYCLYTRLKNMGIKEAVLEDIRKNIMYVDTPLLKLNSDSDNFYVQEVINFENSKKQLVFQNKSQKNLYEAKKQITKYLESIKDINKIQEFYVCLINKFKVNFHLLNDSFEVGVVFETMNNRGRPLTQIDKVKNYLIFLCSRLQRNDIANTINTAFGEVYKSLMNVSDSAHTEDEFLRYSYIIYKGEYKEHDIHKEIKNGLIPKLNPDIDKIISYVNFIVEAARLYATILTKKINDAEIILLLDRLIWLKNLANFIPFLIVLFDGYEKELYTNKDVISILSLLEIYSFRVYRINDRRSNTGQNILYRLAHSLYKKNKTLTQCIDEIKALLHKNGGDYDFKNALAYNNFFERQKPWEIAYLFFEYEHHLHLLHKSNRTPLTFAQFSEHWHGSEENNNKYRLTIEHIAPQFPMKGEPVSYLHNLGNLVLTYDNSALSNREFSNKKTYYTQSELLVERVLSQIEKLNREVVLNRAKEIIDFALERWKL